MKFSEYIDKLKRGTLTPEEEEFVKGEIEKHETISDYVYEQEEQEFSKASVLETNIGEVKKINNYVNKKILRKIVLFVLAVIILGLVINFSMNMLYYNPNKGYSTSIKGGDGQLYIDASAFTELHFPGYEVEYAEAKAKGFGSYEVSITQKNVLSEKEEIYKDKIVMGKIQGVGDIRKSFWKFPFGIAFDTGNQAPNDFELDRIKELPKSARVSAYVGFKNTLTLKEIEELDKKHALWFNYVAVKTGERLPDSTVSSPVVTGFIPSDGGTTTEECKVPQDEYPFFTMYNHQKEIDANKVKVWEQHFKSRLKYMLDRPEFISTMGFGKGINKDFYKNTLEYINKNGVHVYGVHVEGKVNDILEFVRDSNVRRFDLSGAVLSYLSGL